MIESDLELALLRLFDEEIKRHLLVMVLQHHTFNFVLVHLNVLVRIVSLRMLELYRLPRLDLKLRSSAAHLLLHIFKYIFSSNF